MLVEVVVGSCSVIGEWIGKVTNSILNLVFTLTSTLTFSVKLVVYDLSFLTLSLSFCSFRPQIVISSPPSRSGGKFWLSPSSATCLSTSSSSCDGASALRATLSYQNRYSFTNTKPHEWDYFVTLYP